MSEVRVPPGFADQLREAHETYRHLVEGIPAVLYVDANDERSTNIYTSPQVEPLLGFTIEQWRDEPDLWVDRIHEDDRDRVLREHRESLRTGGPFTTEYRLQAADGREVWIRDEAVLVRDGQGEPLFWRGIMTDITPTKRVQDRLRRSLDVLRRTMEDRRAAAPAPRGCAGGGAPADRLRHPRRPDPGHERGRHPRAGDRAPDRGSRAPRGKPTTSERRSAHRSSVCGTCCSSSGRRRSTARGSSPRSAPTRGRRIRYPRSRTCSSFEPSSELRAVLFRIAQEAIANARKHASATRIDVSIADVDGGVRLMVSDDGRGFDVGVIDSPEPGHIGLPTMIERAQLAGGRCRVESEPGHGTSVSAWLPVDQAASADAGA